jgi:hypothetical protein
MRKLARVVADDAGDASPPSRLRPVVPLRAVAPGASTGPTPLLDFDEAETKSQVHFTREQRRSRRKRQVRARSIYTPRLAKDALELGRKLFPDDGEPRPRNREECKSEPRPCPYVSCRYHLYLDVSPRTGSIKLNFPDLEVWELGESCALDVAERGGVTVEHLGAMLNVTRERVRQLEIRALASLHEDLMRTA